MDDAVIYHMCRRDEWEAALKFGVYTGSSQDRADGFIHFSTSAQIVASAARHRSGQTGLVLIAVNAGKLGDNLHWETSRHGDIFPHLYGDLPPSAVIAVDDLQLDSDGRHIFPPRWQDGGAP